MTEHEHKYIELSEGRVSELVCGCGKWHKVRYKGGRAVQIDEGDDYYYEYED